MKIHLADSDSPLTERTDIRALCGEEIKRATFAFMWDDAVMCQQLEINTLTTCRKCVAKYLGRYVYGIVPETEAGKVGAGVRRA